MAFAMPSSQSATNITFSSQDESQVEEKAHAQTEAQKKKDESEIVSHTAINVTKHNTILTTYAANKRLAPTLPAMTTSNTHT